MTTKTVGQGYNAIPTPTWGDPNESLATVWAALEDYRAFLRPEGRGDNDSAWDNIATAMAWLKESAAWDAETMLEAAACLWEAVQEAQGNGVTTPGLESYLVEMRAGFRSQGVAAMRGAVIDSAMVTALESGYRAAVAEGFDSPFDWEFCPAFVRDCMTWGDGLPGLRSDYLDRCKAIGRVGTGRRSVFRSVYYAQGEEAGPDLDRIDRDGAAAWLAELSGAVDLFSMDSDAMAAAPWGTDDHCAHVETTKAGRVYVHQHRGGLYVTVTTETTE